MEHLKLLKGQIPVRNLNFQWYNYNYISVHFIYPQCLSWLSSSIYSNLAIMLPTLAPPSILTIGSANTTKKSKVGHAQPAPKLHRAKFGRGFVTWKAFLIGKQRFNSNGRGNSIVENYPTLCFLERAENKRSTHCSL